MLWLVLLFSLLSGFFAWKVWERLKILSEDFGRFWSWVWLVFWSITFATSFGLLIGKIGPAKVVAFTKSYYAVLLMGGVGLIVIVAVFFLFYFFDDKNRKPKQGRIIDVD